MKLSREQVVAVNAAKRAANKVGDLLESMSDDPMMQQAWVGIAVAYFERGFEAVAHAISNADEPPGHVKQVYER